MAASAYARADWSVKPGTAGSGGCTLVSASVTMPDGYQDTRVRLNINDQRLLVITQSNVDSGFGDIDLQVDGKAGIPADNVVDEQNVMFTTGIATIIGQFRKGNSARVHLRFWPSYPATQRYPAVFSLRGFTRAWNEFLECRN